ncbi:DEKNAAC101288 [Brettanomyces naardenensis]|uniref:DEKNAAC101288 n=1 Tax=Brettanomyces naardenensis TaxID=13370 RepID=A0A448YHN0_BRENA|nr:DEKNAAC101288 [Brettanomyces naardenensis]
MSMLNLTGTKLRAEFVNYANLVDMKRSIGALERIDDVDYANGISEEDPFFVRSFFTITNFSVLTSLDDIISMKAMQLKESKKDSTPIKKEVSPNRVRRTNILLLARKTRMKLQILSSALYVQLSEKLKAQIIIDDVRVDSLTSEGLSLFAADSGYHSTKPMTFASRSIQLNVLEGASKTKMIEVDRFDILTAIHVAKDGFCVEELTLDVNQIEILLQEIRVFKELVRIKQSLSPKVSDIVPRGDHVPKGQSSNFVGDIRHFKFHLGKLKLAACFQNPVKYFDGVDQSEMNKYKRGFSVHVYDTSLDVDNKSSSPVAKYHTSEATFQLIRDFSTDMKQQKLLKFIVLTKVQCNYYFRTHSLALFFPKIDSTISPEVVWSVMFATKVITAAIPTFEKMPSNAISSETSARALKVSLRVDLAMAEVILPSDIRLAVEVDSLVLSNDDGIFKAVRVYVVNPHAQQTWSPLLIFTRGKVMFAKERNIELAFDSMRFEVPFEYVFYETFDNGRAFHKSLAQLALNFRDLMTINDDDKDFSVGVIPPSKADKPVRLPKMKITANEFEFCTHDDPFESQLTRCLLLGQVEQRVRIVKLAFFEKYEKGVQEKLMERYQLLEFENGVAKRPSSLDSSKMASENQLASLYLSRDRSHSFQTGPTSCLAKEVLESDEEEYLLYLKDYHDFIELPKSRLLANFSESWIIRANNSRNFSYKKLWGLHDPSVRREFLDKYPIIVSGNVPALFSLKISDLTLNLDEPSFGLDNYPDFLYSAGGGIPKDMEYGILVPANAELFCSALELRLKDYPLPLLAFGGDPDDSGRSIRIAGDIAIIEQMYVPDELRYNFVPFVSQYHDPSQTDNLYAFHISRTLTNIKFVANLDVQVNSNSATIISWASAIQPALVYAMNSFDVLSKPPIDISPPIGFWDKLPLFIQVKWTFHCHSGIHLFIKAGQSPYDYIGPAAGFLFKWEDNALLKINSTGRSEDFLIVESETFEMAIPTFHTSTPEDMICSRGGRREYSVRKTVLKLHNKPIRWKLGFSFERNMEALTSGHPGFVPRTKEFIPHYRVRLKNPITFVDDSQKVNYDSYRGWRSQYIHMAVSVISKGTPEARNSAHLTPLSFSQFFKWWNTFHESLGLPIKEGKLFSGAALLHPKQKSPKFGGHLFSISYQLGVNPVYLAHSYRHTVDLRANSNVSFTGIKCLVHGLLIDLHQSKRGEITQDADHREMGKDLSLRMTKGIVDFEGADLRIVTAEFNETSAAGMLAQEFGIQGGDSSRSSFDESSSASTSTSSPEYGISEWFDKDDFVELDDPSSWDDLPRWRLLPLASSPRFYYVRDLGDSPFEFPFEDIQTQTHNCEIGKRNVSQEAANLADKRIGELGRLLSAKEDELKLDNVDVNAIQIQIDELQRRLVKLDSLRESFKEGVFPGCDDLGHKHGHESEDVSDGRNGNLSRCLSRSSSFAPESIATTGDMNSMLSSTYKNRFIVYSIEVIWEKRTKNKFLNYADKISDRRSLVFSLSHKAISLAADLSAMPERRRQNLPGGGDYEFELQQSAELMENFDQVLHDTDGITGGRVDDNFLLKFIFPQLRISGSDNSCLLAMSNQVVIRSVDVKSSDTEAGSSGDDAPIETRSGITVSDAYLYVLEKRKALKQEYLFFTPNQRAWPPRLPFEMYYSPETLKDAIVIRNLTAGALIVRPNELYCSKKEGCDAKALKESVRIAAPMVHITANSRQYGEILDCALSLIKYEKTDSQKMRETVNNFVKFSDTEDLGDIMTRIQELQLEAKQLQRCKGILRISDDVAFKEFSTNINIQLERIFLNLNALVGYLQRTKSVKYNDSFDTRHLILSAFNIELELMDDDGSAFVELSAVDTYYSTIQRPDGASQNQVCIFDFIACDRFPDAKYSTVIARFQKSTIPMCFVDWSLLAPVGGITVIQHRTIDLAPMRLQIDSRLGEKIYKFVFPKSCMDVGLKPYLDEDEEAAEADLLDSSSVDSADSYSSYASSSTSSVATAPTTVSSVSSPDNGKSHKSLSWLLKRSRTDSLGSPPASSASSRSSNTIGKKTKTKSKSKEKAAEENNMTEMERRASLYVLGNLITINPTNLCLTFKGTGKLKIINVSNMVLDIPKIEFKNRVLSTEEFLAVFRVKVLRIALRNIPGFIQSKFKRDHGDQQQSTTISSSVQSTALFEQTSRKVAKHSKNRFLDPDLLEPNMGNSGRRTSWNRRHSLRSKSQTSLR